MREETRYYREYTDDFVESRQQDETLPEDFVWLHENIFYRAAAAVLYGIAVIFSFFYSYFGLHIRVVGREKLKRCKGQGIFLYGNHTQPMGDAFAPAMYIFPKRLYTVAGAANLGIPVLGKVLPMLGALIVPQSVAQMRSFLNAMKYHLEHGRCIIVYPEAHVWPYCGFVRPFPETSFRYPVQFGAPAYCMTTTYQKWRRGQKPRITTYIDGPFYPDQEMRKKEAQRKLHDEIAQCMRERSKASTYEYIRYVRKSEE
ncbi:MAG: 1-acyl-sn-glycerol-3-phosphate acyltransferase [Lachnospiraceae bacterium]|nr:1-acyl-sn-glycerol-3-phosphate acyltransferase [Lachnospiraceae bacterium]